MVEQRSLPLVLVRLEKHLRPGSRREALRHLDGRSAASTSNQKG